MTLAHSTIGRSILISARSLVRVADVCTSLDAIPAGILALTLCQLCGAGYLRIRRGVSPGATLETTAVGLAALDAMRVGSGPGDE